MNFGLQAFVYVFTIYWVIDWQKSLKAEKGKEKSI